MAEHRARLIGVGALALLVASCTGTTAGSATPAMTSGSTTDTATTAPSSTVALPPRPEDLPLDGLDPCDALTEDQQVELELDPPPTADDTDAERGCHFLGPLGMTGYGYSVYYRTDRGVEYWFDGPEVGRAIPIEIGGFPAAQYGFSNPYDDPDNDLSQFCFVAVGVADGQELAVQFAPADRDDLPGLAPKCERAREAAEIVLRNLRKG